MDNNERLHDCPICDGARTISTEDLECLKRCLALAETMQACLDAFEEIVSSAKKSKDLQLTEDDRNYLRGLRISLGE